MKEDSICVYKFFLPRKTHHSAAYSFGISNLYAPIGAVQFTLVNWTPHIAAYIFGVSNLYAPTGAVQFTLVNWTLHVAAYIQPETSNLRL